MRRLLWLVAILSFTNDAGAMELSSPDFADNATLPADFVYTRCGGRNLSPALVWSGVPKGTKSLALTLIDTSVRPSGWSHWIVVDLPPDATSLARGTNALPRGASGVKSNFGDWSYDGPCPPEGSGLHRYRFTVWALGSRAPGIKPDDKANSVTDALRKQALASASLTANVAR